MPLGLKKIPIFCSYCSFSSQRLYIYWKEIWHTCRFTIIISTSSSILGMIKQFLMELCPFDLLKKIAIFCSFDLFSSERLHIIKWNFVYSLIIIKSKSGVFLGMINQFLTEIFPLDLDILLIHVLIFCSFLSFYSQRFYIRTE